LWIAGIFFLFLTCLGPGQLLLEALGYLAFGWIGFLRRVVPQIQVRWDMAASCAVCVFVLVIGSHLFLRWLYRQTAAEGVSADGRRWRWRWTLAGAGLVFLMFSAGIGATGVVHQTAWLATSPVPLVHERTREEASRVKCASNLRQIGQALQLYASDHGGHYPDDLLTLLINEDLTPGNFICPSSNDMRASGATTREIEDDFKRPSRCSYTYFGKGLSIPIPENRVIAAEPLENHDGEGMNILFGDGRVEFVDKQDAEKLLEATSTTTEPTTLPAGGP
jgi:prepilin-type processing-associated H-X9-DG protein